MLPRVVGLIIALPLLTVIADVVGLAGGALLCRFLLDMPFSQYLGRANDAIGDTTFWVGVVKAPVFALLIAAAGCYRGLQVRDSARELGRLVTVAVVESIFFVILADALFAVLVHGDEHLMYPVVEVSGLVNRFGTQVVHDGLDMAVNRDEVFGIVGGSGTGKSVLLRTILGLQRPQAGVVRIDGQDITQMSEAQLRHVKSRYGVSFQSGALYSALTVTENVQLPMVEYLHASDAHSLNELALLKIRLVGLPPEAGAKYPAELSGGMVKRVGPGAGPGARPEPAVPR